MGKNISIYLNDRHLQRLSGFDNTSHVVKQALDLFFRVQDRKGGFDQVLSTADKIGDAYNFDEVVKQWKFERGTDRW